MSLFKKNKQKETLISPSQFLIGVKDIKDWYLIVNGWLRWIIWVSWVDFDLLDEKTKDWLLNWYMGFLARMTTPFQEYISSKTLDTSKYLENYVRKIMESPYLSEKHKSKLIKWTKHLLASSIDRWSITEKRFYIIVSMDFKDIPSSSILDDIETEFVSFWWFNDSQWAVIKEKADKKINEIEWMLAWLSLNPYRPMDEEIIQLFKNEFRKDTNIIQKNSNEIIIWLGREDPYQ